MVVHWYFCSHTIAPKHCWSRDLWGRKALTQSCISEQATTGTTLGSTIGATFGKHSIEIQEFGDVSLICWK